MERHRRCRVPVGITSPLGERGDANARRVSDPAGVLVEREGSGLAGDPAGLEARGAHVEALGGAGHDRANPLDVRVPAPLGPAVRVRDAVPETRALAADVAVGSHRESPDRRACRGAATWCVLGDAERSREGVPREPEAIRATSIG